MQANGRRNTAPELALRRVLHRRGFRYRVDKPLRVDAGRPIRPDVVFAGRRVAVFVDGCFWHACAEHGVRPDHNSAYWRDKLTRNVARDRRDERRLALAGWTVLRVWEHEAPEEAAERIASVLAPYAASPQAPGVNQTEI